MSAATDIVLQRSAVTPLEFTEEQRRMIRDTYANGATDAEFAVLMEIAKARRLNPLLRQIHFVSRWDSEKRRPVWSTQVSIDGLRAIAERTGLYHGQDEPEFVENDRGQVICAKVRVWRRDWPRPAVGVAHWDEYVQMARDKQSGEERPTRFWSRMPHVMLGKVAEAIALRKAFPEDMSGLYTHEEMAQAGERETIVPENDGATRDAYMQTEGPPPVLAEITERLGAVVSLETAAGLFVDYEPKMGPPDGGVHSKASDLLVGHLEGLGLKGVKSKINGAIRTEKAKRARQQLPAPVAGSPLAEAVREAVPVHAPPPAPVASPSPEPQPAPPAAEVSPSERAYLEAVDVAGSPEAVLAAFARYRDQLPTDKASKKRLWTYACQAVTTHGDMNLEQAHGWLTQQLKAKSAPTQAEAEKRGFTASVDGPAWEAHLRNKPAGNDFEVMGSYLKRADVFRRRGLDADRRGATVYELAKRAGDMTEEGIAKAGAALDSFCARKEEVRT